ncbi:MAG: SPOR domain-containing protein [Bacteroidota bacterium]
MPNLNLKAGAPAPVAGVRTTGMPGGGGSGGKKIAGLPMPVVILLLVVILLGGGYFALNKAGIIGKKKAVPVVIAPPPVVTPDTAAMTAAVPESAGLVEFKEKTPPGSEKKQTAKAEVKSAPVSEASMSPASVSGSGKYSVQVSSWATEVKAKTEADIMTRAGFPAFVEKANVWGAEKRFRVCIGRYESTKAARGSADKFAHMLEAGYWVVRLSK